LALICAILLTSAWGQCAGSESGANDSDTRYLLFQLFSGGPHPKTGIFHTSADKRDYQGNIREMEQAIGPTDNLRATHKLGFAVGPLALDHSDDEVKRIISDAFALANENDMAMALHLDDYMFWKGAKDASGWKLTAIPDTVEWQDWSGRRSDPMVIGWQKNVPLAPQMCYEAPAIQAAVEHRGALVGRSILEGLELLRKEGKVDLFAGLIVGWESNMADGYNALSRRGFSKREPPPDFDLERQDILHSHIERWSKAIREAGVDRDLIYTHVANITAREYETLSRNRSLASIREHHQSTNFRAKWTAFNEYSNPGLSVYPDPTVFEEIYSTLEEHGNPPWAMTEGTNVTLAQAYSGGAGTSSIDWETYLAKLFNHGARIVNVFSAWQGLKSRYTLVSESDEAVAAYRKFLKGGQLVETASVSETRPADAVVDTDDLRSRVEALPKKLEKYHQGSGDMRNFQEDIKSLDSMIKSGSTEEVIKLLDRIESRLG
jgi:hypothetical protein